MGFFKDLQRTTNIKSISKGIGTGMSNVSSGVGSSIKNIATPSVRALGGVVGVGTDAISSPIMMLGAGIVGLVLITTVMGGSKVANTAMQNPDSIRAVGEVARQFR
jgi:hypothetical protein